MINRTSKSVRMHSITKAILLFATLLLAPACRGAQVAPVSKNFDYNHVRALTVAFVGNSKTQTPYCGGVIIDSNTIVTAAHCIFDTLPCVSEDYKSISCNETGARKSMLYTLYGDKTTYQARVRVFDKKLDGALIETRTKHSVVARLSPAKAGEDELLHVVGHPKRKPYVHSTATISRYVESKDMGTRIWTNAEIEKGSSGGGIWTDDNELIGICVTKVIRDPYGSFYVPIDIIINTLETQHTHVL